MMNILCLLWDYGKELILLKKERNIDGLQSLKTMKCFIILLVMRSILKECFIKPEVSIFPRVFIESINSSELYPQLYYDIQKLIFGGKSCNDTDFTNQLKR